MYGYIYKTTNLVNGKIYIGKHKASEFDPNYKGSGTTYLSNAFKKYGRDNFKVELLIHCFSLEELNAEEKFLIEWFNARDRSVGYNRAEGGDGGVLPGEDNPFYGKHHSDETKQMIREAQNKYWESEDYRAKMHDSRLGNQNSRGLVWIHLDTKLRRVNPNELNDYLSKGWRLGLSSEHRSKIGDSSKGNTNNTGKVRIHKGSIGRMVDRSQLEDYLSNDWELGQSPDSVAKRSGIKYTNRKYKLTCKSCNQAFIGNSPKQKLCSKCKGVD